MKFYFSKHKHFLAILSISVLAFVAVMLFLRYADYNTDISQISSPGNVISAAIAPFEPTASAERQNLFGQISVKSDQTIIVLASMDSSVSVTTDQATKLPNSNISLDKDRIDTLVIQGQAQINLEAFEQNESYNDLLGDVNNYYPDSKLLPLLVSKNLSKEKTASLVGSLNQICQERCFLIAAVDFAQNVPGSLAEIQDEYSIHGLADLDEERVLKSDISSPAVAMMAVQWAKAQATKIFHLFSDFNSAQKTGEPDTLAKSYVSGWFEKRSKSAAKSSSSFIVGGDMMFDRLISARYPNDRLAGVVGNLGSDLFFGTDLSIVNLEGPIDTIYRTPDTTPTNLSFAFPPKTVDVLKWLNINAVSLANNHTLNGGAEMLANTKSVLSVAGITPIGDQQNIGVETFGADPKTTVIGLDTFASSTNIENEIKTAKAQGSFVLVFPHWGSEYQTKHSLSQEKLAHQWIENGADLIIGSHPHVVQDAEIYRGKPIFYSLGNLVFDQTFSKPTQQGLIIAGKITADKLTLVLLPTIQKNLKPELMSGESRAQIIDSLKTSLSIATDSHGYGYDKIELER